MIQDHQRSKIANTLVRASSSNVMLFGNLGNIRQQGGGNGTGPTITSTANHILDYLPRTAKEEEPPPQPQQPSQNGKYPTSVMGNVVIVKGFLSKQQICCFDRFYGRLLEAVFECREAITIDPHYQRAHNRLATPMSGDTEKAMYHYKRAASEADPDVMTKGEKYSNSSQQVGLALVIQAQVDMAAGRIDDALAAAQRATQLDRNNKEVNTVVRRTETVARLDHDPHNSVLLCNRAACRSKLGQFEKALEDCSTALNVRPSFTKARLRKADCYFKMGKWEACIQECETLMKETPENEDVRQMIKDAQQQLKK
ncbi:hypothetical protein HAX54_019087 [Datura stramonium]|uniref:Uncharacterized protein n=1 Tax=Datura stramonium TaxID=4076 RepID=A0ABS8UQM7_DATST|nr:hypothetical protein [Datura stramonium]